MESFSLIQNFMLEIKNRTLLNDLYLYEPFLDKTHYSTYNNFFFKLFIIIQFIDIYFFVSNLSSLKLNYIY